MINEIKTLILETLDLEGLCLHGLADDTPLFEEGLGLDSIDVLELGIAIKNRYDVQLGEEHFLREKLSTVRALAAFIASRQGGPRPC